jgi:hypothetical protein
MEAGTATPPMKVNQMSTFAKFNNALAQKITSGVATMWCAYAFALIALISLPKAIESHNVITIVSWVAQTFLQLVLLSIIMVGQNLQSAGVAQKIDETHTAALAEFELAKQARKDAALEIIELKAIAHEIRVLLDKK